MRKSAVNHRHLQRASVAVVLWLTAFAALAAPAATPVRPQLSLGQPLANALAAYRPLGINVVSSSRLVSRRHRVSLLPDQSLPLVAQIRELLKVHDFALEQLNADTWYVVRQTPKTPPLDEPITDEVAEQFTPVIEEIVVTGSYRLARISPATQRLNAQQLDALPSIGGDALRAVAQLPGVASSGVSGAARVRGGNTNELLYLFDGVELLEPFHLSEFHSLFSSVNSNIIDSIEVFPSGFPARLGGKMSGVVAMDVIEPARFEGALDLNTVVASAHIGGTRGAWNWLASARRSTIDIALEQLERDYGEPKFRDQFVRGNWQGEQQTWRFGLLNAKDAVQLADPTLDENGRSSLTYRTGWLNGEFAVADNLYGTVQLQILERNGTITGELDNDTAEGSLSKDINFFTIKLNNRWSFHGFEQHTLEFGWFAERQNADFSTELRTEFGDIGQAVRGSASIERDLEVDRWGTVFGGFISGDYQVGALDVEWGLRYAVQDIDPAHSNAFEPRLQLAWRPEVGRSDSNADWTFAFDIGRYVQHQDLFQVQIDDGLVELQEPQRNDQVGFSIQRDTATLRTQANLYYRNIHDPWSRFDNIYNPWVLLPELQPDRVELAAEKARVWGAELLIGNTDAQTLRWSLSYAWSKAEERIANRYSDRPWDQTHTLKARAYYLGERWQLGVSLTGRSGWPNTALVSANTPLEEVLYRDNLPDYWSLDLHVARSLRLFGLDSELYLDVTNATNRLNTGGYTYSGDLAAPERRTSRLLPAFPTLGFRVNW